MSASTRILAVIPLQGCSQVRMSRTRHSCKQLIIRRFGILILEDDCQGSTCSVTFEHAAYDLRLIIFNTRCRTLCTALPTKKILLEILLRELQSGRNAVQHHSDEFAMRLTENRHPEFSTECVHIYECLFSIVCICFCRFYEGRREI